MQKSPGLDELRVATHPVVESTIPGSLFSEHLLEMLQAVSTSLDNTIQLAAEGNHGPQCNAHSSAPLPDQAQLEGGNGQARNLAGEFLLHYTASHRWFQLTCPTSRCNGVRKKHTQSGRIVKATRKKNTVFQLFIIALNFRQVPDIQLKSAYYILFKRTFGVFSTITLLDLATELTC